jgi:hypothetical protein
MRSLPLVVAAAMLLGALAPPARAREIQRTSAEDNASYACRVQLTPASRTCLDQCAATFKNAALEEERWSCVQACTTEHLRAIRACREDAVATARALTPSDHASDDDQPIAFDPARLASEE